MHCHDEGDARSIDVGIEIEGSLSGVGAIRNVRIEGNTVVRSTRLPIMMKNVEGAVIQNNTIVAPMREPPTGAMLNYVTYGIKPAGAIFVAASRDVVLSGNRLRAPTRYCPDLIQLGPTTS